MTLPTNINDREFDKFEEIGSEVAVRVTGTAINQFEVKAYDMFYVDLGLGSDANSGADWANALLTVQAAIDKCTNYKGSQIFVKGSATLAAGVGGIGMVVNKGDLAIIGVHDENCPTGGNAELFWDGGFGSGGTTPGAFAAINITKSKVTIRNMTLYCTSIDYPVGIQNMTSANSHLLIEDCMIRINGTMTGSGIKMTTATSYSTFRNLQITGGVGATKGMNQGIMGQVSHSLVTDIIIDTTEGAAIVSDSLNTVWKNLYVMPGCATGLTITDASNVVYNSFVLAAGTKLPGHNALNVNVKLAVD
jgi:hypothetical protein